MGEFDTLLTPRDRSTIQKINKEAQTLNDTIAQLDLIDIYTNLDSIFKSRDITLPTKLRLVKAMVMYGW